MKKKNLFLTLALAGVCALGLTSCAGGNDNNQTSTSGSPAVTTSTGEVTTTNNGDPVVQSNYKYYAYELDASPVLFGVKKQDDKVAEIAFLGGQTMAYLTPAYKDNKIVGLHYESIEGENSNNYITVGNNFVNNIGNTLTAKTDNNNLILSIYDKTITIGFDGSSSATGMLELEANKVVESSDYSLKVSDDSVELTSGVQKIIITKTDSLLSYEGVNTSTGEISYKIVKERKGNIENYAMYHSSNYAPLIAANRYRVIYDSNNRIIRTNSYYSSGYGYYPSDPQVYKYNDNGQIISIESEASYSEAEKFEYDTFGRMIKHEDYSGVEEFTYLENGLYESSTNIYKYAFYGTSSKIVYEYDSNNRVSKQTYYDYDSSTKSFSTTVSSTETFVYNDRGSVATRIYADGSKDISTSEYTLNDRIYSRAKYDSSNNLIAYDGQETHYVNGVNVSDKTYGFYNGKQILKSERALVASGNTETITEYYYENDGSVKDSSTKIVLTLDKGFVVSSYTYGYDVTKKEFKTSARENTLITRDSNNNVTKIEYYDSNFDETLREFTYTNGVLSKETTSYFEYNMSTQKQVFNYKSEVLYSNDFITEYNEYTTINDKDYQSLHSEYNEFCEKTFERYNYYNDKAELTSDSYGYDYTYNEYGIETSYKYCVYNETNKNFNDVISERSYTYSDNLMLTNETYIGHSSNEKISLDYIYDSNNLLESQIRTDYDGDKVDYKVKYVFDYENNKTTEYEFKNGNWEVSYSYNYIKKLDCNPYK